MRQLASDTVLHNASTPFALQAIVVFGNVVVVYAFDCAPDREWNHNPNAFYSQRDFGCSCRVLFFNNQDDGPIQMNVGVFPTCFCGIVLWNRLGGRTRLELRIVLLLAGLGLPSSRALFFDTHDDKNTEIAGIHKRKSFDELRDRVLSDKVAQKSMAIESQSYWFPVVVTSAVKKHTIL
jgi:hypothetical protein